MSRYWSAVVSELTPYVPGEQPKLPGLVKLNTNENPYGPAPQVLAALREAAADTLRLYPDPSASELKQTLAEYHGVSTKEVFVGNGSDEVLALVFMALLKHDAPLLLPDISYSFYPVYCKLYGIDYRTVPLDEQMRIRPDDYAGPCGAIIFPNPNAPTGIGLGLAAVESILLAHPEAVVVVDEAYVDFGGDSAVALIARYPNLLVVQTLSKSRSLAGLRVGFALGQPDLIEALERVKNSFNSYPLDRLSLAGAVASFRDEAYFQQTRQAVIDSRQQLAFELAGMGFEVLPSQANFIFARHPQHDAAQLAAGLRARSVIVRHFNAPRISQFLRISIGSPDECAALVRALRELL
ncbi:MULTISPECIES: histidinol-phosphate transaminase [unclassified Janthinobacterium]|uniref:histidinol-phosphate transaminase n=1 Tax=unclassified Janthinobacterium TaxID=2610881 RepID=UPI00160916D3|nr:MULTISPECIES: histidinol-phosphate transaminase [unclassified Janthinobacterium]